MQEAVVYGRGAPLGSEVLGLNPSSLTCQPLDLGQVSLNLPLCNMGREGCYVTRSQ